jgi:hypothetical protein
LEKDVLGKVCVCQISIDFKKINASTLKKFVATLCDEEKFDPDEGRWTFKSGGDCCCCTDGAAKIALAFHGRIVGYESSQNPTATVGRRQCKGHDFAIIANRFIADYWAYRIANLSATPVFDMDNPRDLKFIKSLYGNKNTWKDVYMVG